MNKKCLCLASICIAVLLVSSSAPSWAGLIELTGTVRDFRMSIFEGGHPDFEYIIADDRGIVKSLLGSDGKPVYNGNPTTPTTNGQFYFDQWYRDTPGST